MRRDHQVVVLCAMQAGRGYALTWIAKAGATDARPDLVDKVLPSFRFTR